MTKAVPWSRARAIAHDAGAPLEATDVALGGALGATLAEPLRALAALPPFEAAAMDGYAIGGAGPWSLVGRVLAGEPVVEKPLLAGQAVEVATGAPVPEGTEAVLPYERARRDGDLVASTAGEIQPGRNIRRRGEDCAVGVELLPAGVVVTPGVLGLAASVGHDALRVRRAPRVAVLVTGDELVEAGLPGRGRVRDAVGPLLPGVVRWAGGVLVRSTRLADDAAALADEVRDLCEADVVAVCGASSAGPADHLRGVLSVLGAEVLVDGVACRPGHPQLLARLGDGRFVVGLPGNPYAALVAALTLLVPLLSGLTGRHVRALERARLSGGVSPHPHDTRLVAVRREGIRVLTVGHDRPGALWGAALADALAVVPPDWHGDDVELLALPTP